MHHVPAPYQCSELCFTHRPFRFRAPINLKLRTVPSPGCRIAETCTNTQRDQDECIAPGLGSRSRKIAKSAMRGFLCKSVACLKPFPPAGLSKISYIGCALGIAQISLQCHHESEVDGRSRTVPPWI